MKKVIVALVSSFLGAVVFAGPAGVVKIWNPAEGGAASGTVKVDGLNSTMIGAVDRQDGLVTNLIVYGNLILNGNTRTNWDEYAYQVLTPYAKYHRTTTNALSATGVWETISFDLAPASENSFGISLSGSNTISFAFNGHVQINGCLRPTWLGNPNFGATMYSRVTWTTNNWTTTNEARCLQGEISRVRGTGEGDTLSYEGSLTVSTNTQIRLQAKVTDTNLILGLHAEFDNPTAATINIYSTGAVP